MRKALDLLQATAGIDIIEVSPLYKTPPWGLKDQDWFINACLSVSCTLAPHKLLETCLETEQKLHRKRDIRWGPRTIDIDILTFDGFASDEPKLTIPHPRMVERAFVLVPLNDIAPDLMVLGKSVSQWFDRIDQAGIEKLQADLPWWQVS
jgi:2-amino-4-hydroxy-6-hydroxymethyldihydropteridine diphosphokinase